MGFISKITKKRKEKKAAADGGDGGRSSGVDYGGGDRSRGDSSSSEGVSEGRASPAGGPSPRAQNGHALPTSSSSGRAGGGGGGSGRSADGGWGGGYQHHQHYHGGGGGRGGDRRNTIDEFGKASHPRRLGYWGRQASQQEFGDTPTGTQLSDADWAEVDRGIVSILHTGSLGDATTVDALEGVVAGLLRKATPATISRYLGTSLQSALLPHQKMLGDSQPQDFLHKCHIRWQSFRFIMLPLLEGVFLPVQGALVYRQVQGVLSIHNQLIVSFRNYVLLADNVLAVLDKALALAAEKPDDSALLPGWFIQMVLEISLVDTKDNRAQLFRRSYADPVDKQLSLLLEQKQNLQLQEVAKLTAKSS